MNGRVEYSIPTLISNYMLSNVWDEITDPFPNFNGCTVEVWEGISNFISHFILDAITDGSNPFLTEEPWLDV